MKQHLQTTPRIQDSSVGSRGLVWSAAALLLLATASTANAGALDRAGTTGMLKLGYVTDDRPFSYTDSAGQAAGYAIEICKRVVEKAGAELGRPVQVEYVALESDERRSAFLQGGIDLLCSGSTETLGRREVASFSKPIFLGGIGVMVRTDAAPRMRALLAGEEPRFRPTWRASYGQILRQRSFVVHSGTTAQDWLSGRIDEFNIIADLDAVDSYDAGVARVVDRRSDAFFGDRAVLADAARRSPDSNRLEVLPRLFTHETYSLAMERGDEDFRLLVDTVISELAHSGEMADLYAAHFGEPSESALILFQMNALPE